MIRSGKVKIKSEDICLNTLSPACFMPISGWRTGGGSARLQDIGNAGEKELQAVVSGSCVSRVRSI